MKMRATEVLAAAVAVWGILGLAIADNPADSPLTTGVFKFNGTKVGAAGGKGVTMLQVAPRSSGAAFEIAIPNNDPNSTKADPNTTAMNVIKDLKTGDFIKVRYNKSQMPKLLDSIEKSSAQPGDSDPEATEFVKITTSKISDQEYQAVVIRKAGKESTVLVPNKKTDDGKMVPDEIVLSQVKKFAECDYVDVETTGTAGNVFIRAIRPYEAPKPVLFVKLNSPEKDANPPLSTVELKSEEKSVVLTIRPGPDGASDPAMLAKVKAFKPSQPVLFKSVEEGGKQWLTDIRAGDPQAADATLNGTFVWSGQRGQNHDLKAVLRPSGSGEWKVVFTFKWGGASKTYTGTVTGDLKNGAVNCLADGDGRHFGFKGTAKNGALTFDCFETVGGKQQAQGNGTLK